MEKNEARQGEKMRSYLDAKARKERPFCRVAILVKTWVK